MTRLFKIAKALVCILSAGLLSGCLSMLLGTNNNQNGAYQQAYNRPGQNGQRMSNQYGTLNQQGTLNQYGTLQGGLNQQGTLNQRGTLNQQGTLNRLGTLTQNQLGQNSQNQQAPIKRGYSASGYQPGYPTVAKPSYQGWSNPDKDGSW